MTRKRFEHLFRARLAVTFTAAAILLTGCSTTVRTSQVDGGMEIEEFRALIRAHRLERPRPMRHHSKNRELQEFRQLVRRHSLKQDRLRY